jgi:hypothetical protein
VRINKHREATKFIEQLMAELERRSVEPYDVRRKLAAGLVTLDSVKAWSGTSDHALDGTEAHAIYISYEKATDAQKEAAKPAKLAGVKLEEIHGRIIGLRRCKDGTIQVLFSNGLRDEQGNTPFRGPNIHKGILCALSFEEGLGVNVAEATEMVPEDELNKLRAVKDRKGLSRLSLQASTPPETEGLDHVRWYAEELERMRPRRRRRARREA